MTDRKPPGVRWESFVEQQIREAMARGDFDRLAGAGRPLPGIDEPHDDEWWIKQKLEREGVALAPRSLALRKEVDDALAAARAAATETDVRRIVADINEQIVYVNKYGATGPPSSLMPLDVEAVVASWRAGRPEPHHDGGPPDDAPTTRRAVRRSRRHRQGRR